MQTEIKNKAVVEKDIKHTEEIKIKKEEQLIKIILKNTTDINGKIFRKGLNLLTQKEYEMVKKFL